MSTIKRLSKFALVMMVALTLVALPAPASATPPEGVSFHTEITYNIRENGRILETCWNITGDPCEKESVQSFFHAGYNEDGLWLRTAHTIDTLIDDNGTITIKSEITGIEGRSHIEGTGRWVVISGTDDYANLHGQGTVSIEGDVDPFPNLTINSYYDGVWHIDP